MVCVCVCVTFLESGVSLIDNESTMHLTISSDFSALSIQNIIASPIDLRSVVKFFKISSNFSFFLKNKKILKLFVHFYQF